ncbi:MAG: hypothetical protein M1825_001087 [Sarcosagium campestre]|nr:MAG: hypothetical protein M1825_001087 [Sarcosagium campestre]
MGCPYEGPNVNPVKVAQISQRLLAMGAYEVSLGDTIGLGTTQKTRNLLRVLYDEGVPFNRLALHLHDTFGQALVNTASALELGITSFDSSVAGLGGCPYAKGATGNVATEDLVHFLHGSGLQTGLDLDMLVDIGDWISSALGRENSSRAGRAMTAKKQ